MATAEFPQIGPELNDLARSVAQFVRREVIPVEQGLPATAREIPHDQLKILQDKARSFGYWMFTAPTEYGGCGLGALESILVTEAASIHRFALPNLGGVFGHEPPLVLYNGTDEQIKQYVVPAIENGWETFTAVTEPTGGSDPARSIRTTARLEGDEWVINGRKMWTTHADVATFGVVYARTGGRDSGRTGISAIVVPAGAPGMTVTEVPVMRDMWSTEVVFDNVRVPRDNLVGEVGGGFSLAQRWFGLNRLRIAAACNGAAAEAIRIGIEWAKQRETFGAVLAKRQSVQFALADAKMKVEASRLLMLRAAHARDCGDPEARWLGSAAKVFATETAFEVIDNVIQMFGGLGVALDSPLPHWFQAIRIYRIVEGPSEIHRFVIAREMLGAAAL